MTFKDDINHPPHAPKNAGDPCEELRDAITAHAEQIALNTERVELHSEGLNNHAKKFDHNQEILTQLSGNCVVLLTEIEKMKKDFRKVLELNRNTIQMLEKRINDLRSEVKDLQRGFS